MPKPPGAAPALYEKYRALVESSPHPMWVFDEQTLRFVAVNDAAVVRYGYSRPEFLAMTIDQIRPPQDTQALRDRLCAAPLQPTYRGIWRHIAKTGDAFNVDVFGRPVTFENRPAHIVATLDISEQEHASRRTEVRTRRLQSAFDHALDAIVLFDDEGRYVEANPAAAAILGYTCAELLTMDVWAVTPVEHRAAGEDGFRAFREAGTMTGEYELLRKDGTRCEVEFRAVADILPGLHLGVMRDVTARRQAEAMVRHQSQILAQIQESIISVDLDLRVTSWNLGAERMYGYSAGEAMGRHISFVYPPEQGELPSSLMEMVLKNGWHELDIRLRRKDGSALFGHLTLSMLLDDAGKPSGVIGSTLDITARTLAEEQVAKAHDQLRRVAARARSLREEERRRLSRDLHDQLGQALTGLKMDLSWIAARLEEPNALAEVNRKAASMLGRIDHTIQNVRRIATGLRPSVLDQLGLIAAIEWQANEFERGSGVRCRVATSTEHVKLDPGRATAVFRIIEQALNNVARHARASSVAVAIGEKGGCLEVSVSDNGRGVAAHRVGAATSLGIIGMRERAALLGGTVEIRGRRAVGTKVTVTIPLGERRLVPREGQLA